MRIGRLRTWALVGVGAGWISGAAAPALAAEGILEINQTCASLSGCFPGDFGGFPVTVLQPGSYRLTSDVVSSFAGAPVIRVDVEAVTIDLNGFTVAGPGIEGQSSGAAIVGGHRMAVRNGFVRDAAWDGVHVLGSSRVEDLHVYGSWNDGVVVARESTLRGIVATSNKGNGIRAGAASVIDGCTATANQGHGISLPSGSVRGSTATSNLGKGGDFGVKVTFATSLFDANGGGDVSGGHASGGNICGDGSCTTDGRKRYYLTSASVDGSLPKQACASGFHMASLFELHEPALLAYAPALGEVSESGSGVSAPAGIDGWVRTGVPDYSGIVAGDTNCNGYSTALAGDKGTTIRLLNSWSQPAIYSAPWQPFAIDCSAAKKVWCVED